MVQRKGMVGLQRFKTLRVGISKYSTWRLASSSSLWEASFAMPTNRCPGEGSNSIRLFSPFVRHFARCNLCCADSGDDVWDIGSNCNFVFLQNLVPQPLGFQDQLNGFAHRALSAGL